jgi:hypothetical protein
MKKKWLYFLIILIAFQWALLGDTLYTTDRKVYEGKMVAFKYDTIYFNVYKFDKVFNTMRFPLHEIWKIELNEPKKAGLDSSFEVEQDYQKLTKGKRSKSMTLNATQSWMDTGIDVKVRQDVLFTATGSIYIDPRTLVYQQGEEYLNWNKQKPLPNQPTGAIIGKVGQKGKVFYIGDGKMPYQMAEAGRLFIGINDFDFKDNTGQFSVTLYY